MTALHETLPYGAIPFGDASFPKSGARIESSPHSGSVQLVESPWEGYSLKDLLYHYSFTKKQIMEGSETVTSRMAKLESEIALRKYPLPSVPTALLYHDQWSLGLVGDNSLTSYYLSNTPTKEELRAAYQQSKETGKKDDQKGQFRLSLDYPEDIKV